MRTETECSVHNASGLNHYHWRESPGVDERNNVYKCSREGDNKDLPRLCLVAVLYVLRQ